MIRVVFVCTTKTVHTIDLYKSAKKVCELEPYILTDSKSSEGLINQLKTNSKVFDLFLIDRFLFRKVSHVGNIWRNIIKLICLPLQVNLLKKFAKNNPNYIYYAHGMYYMWICHFAKVNFAGTPIGSEILIRTYKSFFYKYLSKISIKSALLTTCDSKKMAKRIFELSNKNPILVQNGVEIDLIHKIRKGKKEEVSREKKIVSFRGLNTLYRTKEIFLARRHLLENYSIPIKIIYPRCNISYKKEIYPYLKEFDDDMGKLSKLELLEEFTKYILYISIPKSDSSPRSVYECILSGGIVAITDEDYYYDLPKIMQDRIIIIDLKDNDWLKKSIDKAIILNSKKFDITKINLKRFDQSYSFKLIYEKLNQVIGEKKLNNFS